MPIFYDPINSQWIKSSLDLVMNLKHFALLESYGAFPLHGTARYGSLLGGFPLGTVPGTFLVPPQPRFHASRTVTKT